MKTTKLLALAASLTLASSSSWGVSIAVPTFGPLFSGFINKTAGQTFGDPLPPGWTVSTGYNGFGNVNVVGTDWQSPDGLATVEMDGKSPPGQISTTIFVPQSGIVNISFWLAGDPILDAGFADSELKTLEVQLGSGVGLGPAVTNTFDATGKTLANMGWEVVTDSFLANAGSNTLTFSSLDFAGVDFSNGSDSGPAVGTVTADLVVPDKTSTLVLLGMSAASMMWLSRRLTSPAC